MIRYTSKFKNTICLKSLVKHNKHVYRGGRIIEDIREWNPLKYERTGREVRSFDWTYTPTFKDLLDNYSNSPVSIVYIYYFLHL